MKNFIFLKFSVLYNIAYEKNYHLNFIHYTVLAYFWNFRRIISDCGIRHTVTTRNIDYAKKLKEAGFTTEQILLYTIIKELDLKVQKISASLNSYAKEFVSLATRVEKLEKEVLMLERENKYLTSQVNAEYKKVKTKGK